VKVKRYYTHVVGTRTVTSPQPRAERALVTRRRMISSAYDIFSTEGYLGTTITAVAERAGVAVPTVYYTFGTKTALLGETLGAAILGFDRWRQPPPEPFEINDLLPVHGWWADLVAAGTAVDALDIFVRHGTDILQRVSPLLPSLHGAGGDPEGRELLRISEQRRIETYREVLRIATSKPPGLRPGISLDTATDIVAALFSAETYRGLTARGWSQERCTNFFAQLLAGQIIAVQRRIGQPAPDGGESATGSPRRATDSPLS
jgi:AcrR family transcriptional regulator